MNSEYRTEAEKAVQEARDRLTELFKQREVLDIAIAKQQRRVAALAALVDESEESDQILDLNLGGVTDAVRGVLRGAGPTGLTPIEIRKRLIQMYFPVNEYKNFMASLGSILKRLVKSGEVKRAIHDMHDGRDESLYQWLPKYGATNSLANQQLRAAINALGFGRPDDLPQLSMDSTGLPPPPRRSGKERK
jgi:hypothetical protein